MSEYIVSTSKLLAILKESLSENFKVPFVSEGTLKEGKSLDKKENRFIFSLSPFKLALAKQENEAETIFEYQGEGFLSFDYSQNYTSMGSIKFTTPFSFENKNKHRVTIAIAPNVDYSPYQERAFGEYLIVLSFTFKAYIREKQESLTTIESFDFKTEEL